jgi:RecJ-like exonuclease
MADREEDLSMNDKLLALADKAATALHDADEPILCISHYDCDGIASAIIVNQMLERTGKRFDQVFLDELNEEKLQKQLDEHDHPTILFTDIGSGQIDVINDLATDRKVVIADHHDVEGDGDVAAHCNPHLVGIDGGEKISGAGVTYLLAKQLGEDNIDLVQYALIGATGDMQRDGDEYLGFNTEFVEGARDNDFLEVKKGLKLFGREGKSLVKALVYTTDPYLDGISNDESGAIHFLRSAGIDFTDESGSWRSLSDLSQEEEKQLVHELIVRGYGDIEKLLGDVYMLNNGWEIREFASLLNACGRLDNAEAGLAICLEEDFDLAWKMKRKYGRKIGNYLGFVEDNLDNDEVVRELEHGTAITAGDNIHANMIGTVASICISSDIVEGPVVLGMAEKAEDHLKISGRAKPELVEDGFDMNTVMDVACQAVDGEGGGHSAAAGGKIPRGEQATFINVVDERVTETVGDL